MEHTPPSNKPKSAQPTAAATDLTPEQAHDLVIELEHAGVPPEAIEVEGTGVMTNRDMQAADARAANRISSRVAVGASFGAALGPIVAIVIVALTSASGVAIYLGAAIVGGVLGGLSGLYSGLTLQRDAVATDAPGRKDVSVDTSNLDADDTHHAQKAVEQSAGTA